MQKKKPLDLDLSQYGFTLVKEDQGKKDWFAQFGGYEIKEESTINWIEKMQNINEVVFITAIPCLTILFVVFIYTIVKIFYNYAKVFEAKSKKKISELGGIEIESGEHE